MVLPTAACLHRAWLPCVSSTSLGAQPGQDGVSCYCFPGLRSEACSPVRRDKRVGAELEEMSLPGQKGPHRQIYGSTSLQGARGWGLCQERDAPDPGMPRHWGQGGMGKGEEPGREQGPGWGRRLEGRWVQGSRPTYEHPSLKRLAEQGRRSRAKGSHLP